jgi:hypothetical protein
MNSNIVTLSLYFIKIQQLNQITPQYQQLINKTRGVNSEPVLDYWLKSGTGSRVSFYWKLITGSIKWIIKKKKKNWEFSKQPNEIRKKKYNQIQSNNTVYRRKNEQNERKENKSRIKCYSHTQEQN